MLRQCARDAADVLAPFAFAVLTLFTSLQPLAAQESLPLAPGARVRLATTGAERIEGSYLRTSEGALLLAVGASERSVPAVAVEQLWERGRATGTGAIIGAVTGAALLGLFAAAATGVCAKEGCNQAGAAASGAVLGAAGGGLLGALVGSLIPKWRQRHP